MGGEGDTLENRIEEEDGEQPAMLTHDLQRRLVGRDRRAERGDALFLIFNDTEFGKQSEEDIAEPEDETTGEHTDKADGDEDRVEPDADKDEYFLTCLERDENTGIQKKREGGDEQEPDGVQRDIEDQDRRREGERDAALGHVIGGGGLTAGRGRGDRGEVNIGGGIDRRLPERTREPDLTAQEPQIHSLGENGDREAGECRDEPPPAQTRIVEVAEVDGVAACFQ